MNNHSRKPARKNSRFSETLEEKARGVAAGLMERRKDKSLTGIIEREIALTIEQIDRLRGLHGDLRKNLLRLETYIDTDLLRLKPRPHNHTNRHAEREKLKGKLLKIEEERRRLAMEEEEKLQNLHGRLLSLLQKLGQLRIENGR